MEVLLMKKYSKFAFRAISLLLAAVLLIGPLALGGEAYAADTAKKGTTTASLLFIRSGAGTNYSAVGKFYKGDTVEILEKKTVNGTTWGRCSKGWVSLDYVQF
jgi:uncharacterized protein YraI